MTEPALPAIGRGGSGGLEFRKFWPYRLPLELKPPAGAQARQGKGALCAWKARRKRSLTGFEDAVDNGLGEILVVQEAANAAARLVSAYQSSGGTGRTRDRDRVDEKSAERRLTRLALSHGISKSHIVATDRSNRVRRGAREPPGHGTARRTAPMIGRTLSHFSHHR